MLRGSNKSLVLATLLVLPCFIYYLPSISSFFTEDDFQHLYGAARNSPLDIYAIFKPRSFFYRPLSDVYFGVMLPLFGLSPLPYHLSALCLFCVNVLLTFCFGRMIFKDDTKGFLVALLYLTRGVHFDTVTWIAIFQDLLMCFFSFSCLVLYAKYSLGKTRWLFLSLTAYTLACLSKETALLLPLIILAYELTLNQGGAFRKRVLDASLFFATMALFGVARYLYVPPMPSAGEYEFNVGFFFIPKLANYFTFCINILFLPHILIVHYHRYSFQIFLCLLAFLGATSYLVLRFQMKEKGESFHGLVDRFKRPLRLSAFGLAFFIIGAAPALPIGRYEPYYMSLASLGVCIIIASSLTLISNRRLRALAVVIMIIISLFVNVQLRTRRLSHALRFSSLAERVLHDLREPLGPAHSGKTIYIMDSDKDLISGIFLGYGIKLFFPAVESVVFDLLSPRYEMDGSEMIFRYSDGHLELVRESPRLIPEAEPEENGW